jgi:hypothetical protein
VLRSSFDVDIVEGVVWSGEAQVRMVRELPWSKTDRNVSPRVLVSRATAPINAERFDPERCSIV